MSVEREAAGFKRLGETGVRGLGLSGGRARALSIETAWRQAAGESIARRAVVRRLARGVLEIDIAEAPWRVAIARLLPEIEARLKRDHPALRVEQVRMMDD